jgi:hypothetical protein
MAVAFLVMVAVTARAASDWIDELPTVTTVAHAVTEQLKVDTANWNFNARGIALQDDDDLFAVYLVGTLVHLRKIILFKYQEEKFLSPERETKLKSVVTAYLGAELQIGQGVGARGRCGYLTTAQKCRDMDCYRRWFKTGYSNVYIGASYRGRIFSRLFSGDRAAELDRLAQSYAGRTPYLPSPAETLTIESEQACVAWKGCSMDGGDANRNGLCDDWQNRPPTTPGNNALASACPAIESTGGDCSRPGQPVFSPEKRECKNCENQWMEVKIGVSARQPGNIGESKFVQLENCDREMQKFKSNPPGQIDDGISIRVKCAQGHVVQFISREYWLTDKDLESGPYGVSDPANPNKLACFEKTIDTDNPEKRNWRIDSRGKPIPYYDSGGAYITTCDSMTTIDAPSVQFDPKASKYHGQRAVAKSFAICDGKVVSVVDWSREFFAGSSKSEYHVQPPREPTPDEIKRFQGKSCEERFNPWP